MKSESLTFSLLSWRTFPSLCFLIVEARTSSTMVKNSGDGEHPCPVPDLRGKALKFSFEDDVLHVSSVNGFYDVEYVSLSLHSNMFLSRKYNFFCQMFLDIS